VKPSIPLETGGPLSGAKKRKEGKGPGELANTLNLLAAEARLGENGESRKKKKVFGKS